MACPPLFTNDRTLIPQQVLKAHKKQQRLENRFEQRKTVHEIAPVFLKNRARIEAFFTVYFLALLIQALIERELRQTMKCERLNALPLFPEERRCAHPTTEQVLRLFSHAERHFLSRAGRVVQSFEPEFTPLQRQVLDLLGVHNVDECIQAERLPVTAQLPLYSMHFRSNVARIAMIVLTVAAAVVAIFNYATHTETLATIAELSLFSLLFHAVGHILLSIKHHAWMPGPRSAAFLVLPYTMAALTVVATGQAVRTFWSLALGGLITLPAAILISLAIAKGAQNLLPGHWKKNGTEHSSLTGLRRKSAEISSAMCGK